MKYPVTAIFGPTLQGEGHFVGYPMTFVRLAGCSILNCSIRLECDEAPWKAKEALTAEQIVVRVRSLCTGGIVLVTGGEPGDHDLIPLVSRLSEAGYRIHIETSGTRALTGLPVDWLTVSPKVFDYRQRTGHVLKLVVRPDWTWSVVRRFDEGTDFFHRYLQPLSNPNTGAPMNLDQVKKMVASPDNAMTARWALSTQAHRVWGVQ